MLEHERLLIRRTNNGYVILDAVTSQPLGSARWRVQGNSKWRRWLSRETLDVVEAEDEPLVFSVRRLWGLSPKWEVCDADGLRVSVTNRRQVVDSSDGRTFMIQQTGGITFLQIVPAGSVLAHCSSSSNEIRVTMAGELNDRPLIKMALLAAILVHPAIFGG